jgi:hypothetical protein
MRARDGTKFYFDGELLRGGRIAIGAVGHVPSIGDVVARYDDLTARIGAEAQRKARKLGRRRPDELDEALFTELVGVIVLELLRVRNGQVVKKDGRMNFANDYGVCRSLFRHLTDRRKVDVRVAHDVGGYLAFAP